ncbi:type II toxin-antitoxin system VapC family toxin [Candidatus Electronema sp. PJ]|uniref:type II toxin-antitoxin system VapC family toxin n=1 Tax=Candidatus Electronema sp. PJ TaxID=3401572 RepID=UPI003AA9C328
MYTVDASVWINGFDQREKGHEHSRALLEFLRKENIPMFIPNLVLAEAAGTISRTRQDAGKAQAFAAALSRLPNIFLIPLDSSLAERAASLAAQHGLRGADSVYAAVAKKYDCILISLDNEHLTRLAGVVAVQRPEDALKN